ncbi:MAG: hypothetical protein DMF77_04985 [Acidobacteria bacterium]|nr:MAG: hypothetical protein DMF77_04985 [Acidobacteriota bacterium]
MHEHAGQGGQRAEHELRTAMAKGGVGGKDQEGQARRMDGVQTSGRAVLRDVPREPARVEARVLGVREFVGEIEITIAPEALCHRQVVGLVTLRTRRPGDPRRERRVERKRSEKEEQARHASRLAHRDPPRQGQPDGGARDEGQHRPLQREQRKPVAGVDGDERSPGEGKGEEGRAPAPGRIPGRDGGEEAARDRQDDAQEGGRLRESPPHALVEGHNVEARVP